jgi:hypothetical protein
VTDPVAWPILEELLECVQTAFYDLGDHPDPPPLICHRTGAGTTIPQFRSVGTKVENECCGGLAWVRLRTFYPTAGSMAMEFAQRAGNCFEDIVVQADLGALRCWPHAGGYASCEDWATNARGVAEDAAALRRAIKCCWGTGDTREDGLDAMMGQWVPAGIDGQCVGGILPVTIGTIGAGLDCCPPTSP